MVNGHVLLRRTGTNDPDVELYLTPDEARAVTQALRARLALLDEGVVGR